MSYCSFHNRIKLAGTFRNVNEINTYELLRGTGKFELKKLALFPPEFIIYTIQLFPYSFDHSGLILNMRNYKLHVLIISFMFLSMPFFLSADEKPEVYAQLGHTDPIESLAFSPDGRYIVSIDGDGVLKLWDVSSEREIRTFNVPSGSIYDMYSVAYSPDGKHIVSSATLTTSYAVILWDVSSGRKVRNFQGHDSKVNVVAFSSDGKYVVSGDHDGTIKLWDVSSGREVQTFTGHGGYVESVNLSPNGKYVAAAGSHDTVKLWDVSSGKVIKSFKGNSNRIRSVAFSPDGKNVVALSESAITIWDISTGMKVRTIEDDDTSSFAISPDGKYVISGGGHYVRTLKLWDVLSGEVINTFRGHANGISCVAYSYDGRYVVSGDHGGTIKLWDVSVGSDIKTFKTHSGRIRSVAFSPDGKYVATGSDDKSIKLWEVSTKKVIKTLKGHINEVAAVAFSPDGKYIVSGDPKYATSLKLWEVASGREVRSLEGQARGYSVAFSPDGKHVISGGGPIDETVKLWDVSTGKVTRVFKGSIFFSPDGKYAVSEGDDNTLKLRDVSSGRDIKTFRGHTDDINSVAFSPDGRYIVSGDDDGIIKLWDVSAGSDIKTFKTDSDRIRSVAFSPDGKHVLSGSGETLKLWDVSSGIKVRTFRGHRGRVSSAVFSSDGKYIASGDYNGIIKLWEVLINDVPVVTAAGTTAYTENGSAAIIDNTITISDADDTDITGATVTISSGLTSGDVLGFTNQNSISGKYKSWNGLLTLSGTATLARYQAALRSVTYSSTSDDPTATAASRTISWQVTDADSHWVGAKTSMGVSSTINLTAAGDAPVVTVAGTTVYTEYGSAAVIDNTITISDADDTDITGATVAISSGLTSGDVLGFTDQGSITGRYKSGDGLLTLGGTATLAQYQAVLRSVTYSSTFDNPTATAASRTISWQVTDADSDGVGAQASMGVTSTINLAVVAEGADEVAVEEWVEEELCEEEVEWEEDELWEEDEEWEDEEWEEGGADHSFCTLKGHSKCVNSVAFSPDGKFVASGSDDKTIKLWEISTKKVIKTLKGHKSEVTAVAFSPDGKYIVSGDNKEDSALKLWEVSSGREVRSLEGQLAVYSLTFSPDGKHVISGGLSHDETIKLWDVSTGRVTRVFSGHRDWVRTVAFSPDGKYVVSGSDDNILKLWDVSSGREVRMFRGHDSRISAVAFSPDGKYVVSGSDDNILKLWDISSGRDIKSFRGHTDDIDSVAFSPDGRYIVSGDGNGTLKFWDIATTSALLTLYEKDSAKANSVAFSPDGKYVVSGDDHGALKFWDLSKKSNIKTFKGNSSVFKSAAFSPDGKYVVSGSVFGHLMLWDIKTGKEVKPFIGHMKDVQSIAFSPDGRYIVSGDYSGIIKLWDVSTGKEVKSFEAFREIEGLTFSPDGKYVVSLSDSSDQIFIWDVSTGMKVRTIKDDDISSFAISPDGKYIVTGSGIYTKKFGKLWDFYSGKMIKNLTFKKGYDIFGDIVYISSDSLDFSPDGRHVVSSYNIDNEFYLLDVSTDRKVRTFKGHTDHVNSVAFSPDGKYILSGSRDKTLKLWEVSSGREVRTFDGHKSHVSSVAFSVDGEYAISTSSDSTVKLWSIKSGKEIAMIVSFKGGEWVVMTPEGFFNSSTEGAKNLNVKIGNIVSSIDQFYDALYRPDLVRAKLHGDPERIVADANAKINLASLLTQGSAPRITFVSPKESSIKKRNVEVELDVLDQGGGIGKVVWKINGVTISVEDQGRGMEVKKLVTTSTEPVRIWKLLTLSPGANVIEVIAYNAGGGIASKPARLSVILKDAISEKPALYVLAVGINRYRDKALWLKYAVPDAKDFVASIGNAGKTVFTDIHFKEIHDSVATLNGIKTAFITLSKQIKTNDVFVLYLAGHGITLDGRYHFLPVDFRYYNEDSVRGKAINQDHLQEWMGCVKAQKSLVLLDTCNSGSYVQAQVVARGLAEKTAIDKLTRATGRATIAGSSDSQVAFEGYEGHGVFTYVLLEALQQADTRYGNRDGVTSTGEIASYVNERVPEITYKKWGYEQVPQVNLHGREFPIGVTK